MIVRKKKQGFTLIEMIIVIGIILVLAGFLFPKFSGYQEKAKRIKAINTAKQIYTAVVACMGENDANNAESVENSIKELTGASISSVIFSKDSSNKDTMQISYTSDKNNYIMTITIPGNKYEVSKGNKVIFSQDMNSSQ